MDCWLPQRWDKNRRATQIGRRCAAMARGPMDLAKTVLATGGGASRVRWIRGGVAIRRAGGHRRMARDSRNSIRLAGLQAPAGLPECAAAGPDFAARLPEWALSAIRRQSIQRWQS